MITVEQIEQEVEQLAPADLAKFGEWFHGFEWKAWDLKIEQDSKAGKLKEMADRARIEHAAGRTRPV